MGKKLFVGNLNFKTNDDDLRTLFSQAGTCDSATVMMDRATGRSRGFGFVEMSTDEEAAKAVQEFNGREFQGRNLNVNEARERTPGGGGGGPRGGGYGGGYAGGGGGRGGYAGGGDRGGYAGGGGFGGGGDFGGGFGGGGGGDFGGGFGGGGGGGNFKPRKEGGSRRGLRAKKRSL
ncbi:MAG TPA: RNA-binding protein [Thermoanaerobaculia bacterium]|jgi:RNA recognition motif-containing protein